MKFSPSITALAPALVKAQAEIKTIAKDSTNPHFKNRYASLETIIEAVRPVLAKHGLALIQGGTSPDTDDAGEVRHFTVESMILHTSGEWISSGVVMPLGKQDAQGAGGAMTYGRRYSLSALLALATDDDDDGTTASRPREQAPARPSTEKPPHAKLMPFGEFKGKPLGEIATEALASTVGWCKTKDAAKFADLIAACDAVIKDRVAALADGGDDLPFD